MNFFFQFNRNSGKASEETNLWIAYTAFHLGDYKKSMEVNFHEVWLLLCHTQSQRTVFHYVYSAIKTEVYYIDFYLLK